LERAYDHPNLTTTKPNLFTEQAADVAVLPSVDEADVQHDAVLNVDFAAPKLLVKWLATSTVAFTERVFQNKTFLCSTSVVE